MNINQNHLQNICQFLQVANSSNLTSQQNQILIQMQEEIMLYPDFIECLLLCLDNPNTNQYASLICILISKPI